MTDKTLYESVPRLRAIDSVVASIQSLIVQQKLQSGDALPSERELASSLAVSRSLLREALGILGQRGLVESRPGNGTFVRVPSGDRAADAMQLLLELGRVSLVELCDARLLIEPELAALAASNMNPASELALTRAFAALESSSNDAEAHVQADLAFHGAIAEASQHEVFRAIVEAVREPVTRGMIVGTTVPRAIDYSDVQHEVILQRILAGKVEEARSEMRVHLTYVRNYLIDNDITTTVWNRE